MTQYQTNSKNEFKTKYEPKQKIEDEQPWPNLKATTRFKAMVKGKKEKERVEEAYEFVE